jgi:hypothetical protein
VAHEPADRRRADGHGPDRHVEPGPSAGRLDPLGPVLQVDEPDLDHPVVDAHDHVGGRWAGVRHHQQEGGDQHAQPRCAGGEEGTASTAAHLAPRSGDQLAPQLLGEGVVVRGHGSTIVATRCWRPRATLTRAVPSVQPSWRATSR